VPESETGSDRTTLIAFLAMVVGIAGNVIAVRYIASTGDLDPMWAATSRFVLAALIFTVVARVVHARMPHGRALVGAILYGALTIGAFFAFVYWGLQEAPAGLAGVLLATGPLLTYLFALAHGQERFRWDSIAGAAAVVLGTAVIFSVGLGGKASIPHLLAVLAASACAAEGAVIVKGFPDVHPAARNAIGMAVGAVMLLILMPLFGESFSVPTATSTWVAQAYLVTFGTIGVFGLYLFVLSRWTASATSYEFVLAPVVGIALAAWLLDEAVTPGFAVGSIIVLVGVYLGALRSPRDEDA